MLPLRGFLQRNPSLSLPSFWWVAYNHWYSLAYRCIVPIPPLCDFLPVCFSLHVAVFLQGHQSYWTMGPLYSSMISSLLIISAMILLSNKARFYGLGPQHIFSEGTNTSLPQAQSKPQMSITWNTEKVSKLLFLPPRQPHASQLTDIHLHTHVYSHIAWQIIFKLTFIHLSPLMKSFSVQLLSTSIIKPKRLTRAHQALQDQLLCEQIPLLFFLLEITWLFPSGSGPATQTPFIHFLSGLQSAACS